MTRYLCEWRIDIDADSPEEAAELAERMMTGRLDSYWNVTDEHGNEFGRYAMVPKTLCEHGASHDDDNPCSVLGCWLS